MKKLFLSILVICSLLGGNAYANVKILECKQIVEIDDDIGDDIIVKHIVKINLDSKSIKISYPYNNADNTLWEILKVTDDSIEARSLSGLSGEQYIELNRYTLDLIYHFYSEDSVYQGGSSPFGCNKLEKKI
jgi:hypothetical protein